MRPVHASFRDIVIVITILLYCQYFVNTFYLLFHIKAFNNASMGEKKTFSFRIDEPILKPLRHLAIDLGRSVGSLLEEAIKDVLKKYESKNRPQKGKP